MAGIAELWSVLCPGSSCLVGLLVPPLACLWMGIPPGRSVEVCPVIDSPGRPFQFSGPVGTAYELCSDQLD